MATAGLGGHVVERPADPERALRLLEDRLDHLEREYGSVLRLDSLIDPIPMSPGELAFPLRRLANVLLAVGSLLVVAALILVIA
jgi:hypothetical protein